MVEADMKDTNFKVTDMDLGNCSMRMEVTMRVSGTGAR